MLGTQFVECGLVPAAGCIGVCCTANQLHISRMDAANDKQGLHTSCSSTEGTPAGRNTHVQDSSRVSLSTPRWLQVQTALSQPSQVPTNVVL